MPRYLKGSDALMVVSALPARVILDVGAGSPFVKLCAVVVHFSVLMWMLDHLLKRSSRCRRVAWWDSASFSDVEELKMMRLSVKPPALAVPVSWVMPSAVSSRNLSSY